MEFDNSHKFTLLLHDGRAYKIKIMRAVRTTPFPEMKQPVPYGGMMGMDCMVSIIYNGLPVVRQWRLYEGDKIIAEGMTDENGESFDLPIPMYYYGIKKYGFELVAPN